MSSVLIQSPIRATQADRILSSLNCSMVEKSQSSQMKLHENAKFIEFRNSLNDFCVSNDRRKAVNIIKSTKLLMCVPLKPFDYENVDEAIENVAKDKVSFNGLSFFSSSPTNINMQFMDILQELATKYCEIDGVKMSPFDLFDRVMLHLDRINTTMDTYNRLNELLASADIIFIPRPPVGHNLKLAPLELEMFVSDGVVHATTKTVVTFGLFNKSDLKESLGFDCTHYSTMKRNVDRLLEATPDRILQEKVKNFVTVDAIIRSRITFGESEICTRTFCIIPPHNKRDLM